MTKIAFMFPGQGSFAAGMGRDVALAVPEAMAVYDEGSAASGMDLKELCFERPVEDLVDTQVQQPALVTTSLALDAALRSRGIIPDVVVGEVVPASTPGTVVGKAEVTDADGVSLGWVAVYSSIT